MLNLNITFRSLQIEIIILPLAKKTAIKIGVPYENKNVYFLAGYMLYAVLQNDESMEKVYNKRISIKSVTQA